MLVADVEHQLAGFIVAIGNNLKRTRRLATIVLGVDEKFQRKGIAIELFEFIFTWTKKTGITRLELTVIQE